MKKEDVEKAKQTLKLHGYFGNLNFHYDDIQERLAKNGSDIVLTEEQLELIANVAEKIIKNHDSIYECYWLSIDDAIEQVIK